MSPEIKVYISPYQLKTKYSSHIFKGCLLLFDFQKDLVGYSDFFPRNDLGDLCYETELENLKKGTESLAFMRARELAFQDAQARKDKRNLFYGLKIPESHLLINDISSFKEVEKISKFQYKILKAKLSFNKLKRQVQAIKEIHSFFPFLKWRLDFNGKLLLPQWKLWEKELHFLHNQIDFIEDPFFYSADFKRTSPPYFAEDWKKNPYSSIYIAKPSRYPYSFLIKQVVRSCWKRIVFTHNLNHPLGQVADVLCAAQFYYTQPHFAETGGFHCSLYEENDFTIPASQSATFAPPYGFGLGFEYVLNKQKWKRWV